jgi:TatD DNase family protein
MRLIDSHAHLTDSRFSSDLTEVLSRAGDAGIKAVINAGFDLPSSRQAVELSKSTGLVYAAAGIHPHEAGSYDDGVQEELRKLVQENKVVAIGEIGLDYYYDLAPRRQQQDVFRAQLRLAVETGLPVIVHDRDAHEDVLAILQEEEACRAGGVMHCFSGDTQFAAACLQLGFYVSLAGPVTFKNARDLVDVAAYLPGDRILLETDAPYLAPVPYRGKRNEPAYVLSVAQKVAEIRGVDIEALASQTTDNAIRLFGLGDIG